jgi:predicted GNAT family N-acyltransferase
LSARLRAADRIAVATLNGTIVATASLKVPTASYRQRVLTHAGLREPVSHLFEVGYVVVEENHRGRRLATRVVAACISGVNEFMFATSRADNHAIHRVLEANGFERIGTPYRSSRGAYDLIVHTRDPREPRNRVTTEPNREAEQRGDLRCYQCGAPAKWFPWGDAWVAACAQRHAPEDDAT